MLSSMVKDHMAKQSAVKEVQGNDYLMIQNEILNEKKIFVETKRKEACAAASQLTQALVDHLNVG